MQPTFSYIPQMSSRSTNPSREEWLAASREEREAWEKVKDHPPGSPAHDPVAWARWEAALKKAAEASRRLPPNTNTH